MRTPGPPTTSSSSSTPGPTILSPPPSSGIVLVILNFDTADALLGVDDIVADGVPDVKADDDVQDC